MIVVVAADDAAAISTALAAAGESVFEIGRIEAGDDPRVRYAGSF